MSATLALALLILQDVPVKLELGDIQARLYYTETGRLSENILSRKDDTWWHNTIIGEGGAEESADDILMSVQLSVVSSGTAEENHVRVESPVVLEARDRNGKVLGQRTYDSVLTSYAGKETKALWLNDVTCAGEITLTARYNGKAKTAKLAMGCGE